MSTREHPHNKIPPLSLSATRLADSDRLPPPPPRANGPRSAFSAPCSRALGALSARSRRPFSAFATPCSRVTGGAKSVICIAPENIEQYVYLCRSPLPIFHASVRITVSATTRAHARTHVYAGGDSRCLGVRCPHAPLVRSVSPPDVRLIYTRGDSLHLVHLVPTHRASSPAHIVPPLLPCPCPAGERALHTCVCCPAVVTSSPGVLSHVSRARISLCR